MWEQGMPTHISVNSTTLVVSKVTNMYVDLNSPELKQQFDVIYDQQHPNTDPLADYSLGIGILSAIGAATSPIVGTGWEDFPWLSFIRLDQTIPSIADAYTNAVNEYEIRIEDKKLSLYRQMGIIY